jgi:hypothetical protein
MAYKYTSTTKGVVLLPLRKQHTITKTNYAINMYSNKVCACCFKFWKIFLFHVRFNYFVENCFFVVSYPLQLYSKWKHIFVIFIMCCSYFGPNLSQMITKEQKDKQRSTKHDTEHWRSSNTNHTKNRWTQVFVVLL